MHSLDQRPALEVCYLNETTSLRLVLSSCWQTPFALLELMAVWTPTKSSRWALTRSRAVSLWKTTHNYFFIFLKRCFSRQAVSQVLLGGGQTDLNQAPRQVRGCPCLRRGGSALERKAAHRHAGYAAPPGERRDVAGGRRAVEDDRYLERGIRPVWAHHSGHVYLHGLGEGGGMQVYSFKKKIFYSNIFFKGAAPHSWNERVGRTVEMHTDGCWQFSPPFSSKGHAVLSVSVLVSHPLIVPWPLGCHPFNAALTLILSRSALAFDLPLDSMFAPVAEVCSARLACVALPRST